MMCLVWAVGYQLSAIQPEHRCLADSREPTADSRLLGNVPTPEYRSRRLADERLAALPAGNMRQSDVNVKGNSFARSSGGPTFACKTGCFCAYRLANGTVKAAL